MSKSEISAAKHTPGPWSDGKLVGISGQDYAGLNLGFVNTNEDDYRAECRANARLIAAAPELLEALIGLCTFSEAAGFPTTRARTAIAKAIGGSQ